VFKTYKAQYCTRQTPDKLSMIIGKFVFEVFLDRLRTRSRKELVFESMTSQRSKEPLGFLNDSAIRRNVSASRICSG
jgi:hypothetical protein